MYLPHCTLKLILRPQKHNMPYLRGLFSFLMYFPTYKLSSMRCFSNCSLIKILICAISSQGSKEFMRRMRLLTLLHWFSFQRDCFFFTIFFLVLSHYMSLHCTIFNMPRSLSKYFLSSSQQNLIKNFFLSIVTLSNPASRNVFFSENIHL